MINNKERPTTDPNTFLSRYLFALSLVFSMLLFALVGRQLWLSTRPQYLIRSPHTHHAGVWPQGEVVGAEYDRLIVRVVGGRDDGGLISVWPADLVELRREGTERLLMEIEHREGSE